jgi:hypothetical protein
MRTVLTVSVLLMACVFGAQDVLRCDSKCSMCDSSECLFCVENAHEVWSEGE